MPSTGPAAERRFLISAAFAVLLTRVPWIGADYGSDPDSYRVVGTARVIARTGHYEASRLPGYPAYEYLTALTASGPAWATNLVTALCSVAAFVLFALMLSELGVRRHRLLALAFALVPVIYLDSCCAMDYIPALAAMLAASYATLRNRPLIAGAMLGLAVGFRITAGALALPLCLWMLMSMPWKTAIRPIALSGAAALAIAALCFLPVFHVYGLGFFTFFDNDNPPPFEVVFARAVPLVWGPIGAVAIGTAICALALFHRHVREVMQQPRSRRAVYVALFVILLYAVAFLRLPDESGYLAALVPWVLLALGLLLPPAVVTALAVALMVSPWGAMVDDHLVRESQRQQTQAIIKAAQALPGSAVIVSGWVLPRLNLTLDGDRIGPHQFIYLIEDEDDYRHYLAQGQQIYYLPGVDFYESQAHQLELADMGALQLPVPRERLRPASSGE